MSVKTIRDIWNRETWVKATRALWTPDEAHSHVKAQLAKLENEATNRENINTEGADATLPGQIVPLKRHVPDDDDAEHSDAGTWARARTDDEISSEEAEDKKDVRVRTVKPISAACALKCESAADADAIACLLTLQFAR